VQDFSHMSGTPRTSKQLTRYLRAGLTNAPPTPRFHYGHLAGFGERKWKPDIIAAQAQICIALARQITDNWVVVSLHEMAAKYISHAARLEAVETVRNSQPEPAARQSN
jgi:hypothetical protein